MSEIVVRDQREPGWFFIDNEIIDKYGARLGAYGISVYAVLSRRCKNSTQEVSSLSQRDIGNCLGISQDRVRKSLGDLAEFGLIHVEVPARPSPGVISTITLLKVKTTERHTFSSGHELNATRSRNKEVKTKTDTPPLFLEGFDFELPRARARDEQYRQEDFDQRDLRALHKAKEKLELDMSKGYGSRLSNNELFAAQCEMAGLSVKKALEVIERGKQWPETRTMGASA